MSLVHRKSTPAIIKANRNNAEKYATGPRTPTGKRNSSLSAGKHWGYSRIFRPYLEQIGEGREGFKRLRQGLIEAFQPSDSFERGLVEEMAELRWRRQRLVRAQQGLMVERQRSMESDRQRRRNLEGKGAAGGAEKLLMATEGVASLPDSTYKFGLLLGFLRDVRARVELNGFDEEALKSLRFVYGPHPGFWADALIAECEDQVERRMKSDDATREAWRRSFLTALRSEIESFEKLEALHRETLEISQPAQDATFLPGKKELKNLLRMERAIELTFQLKLDQWFNWRRAKRQEAAIDASREHPTVMSEKKALLPSELARSLSDSPEMRDESGI